MRVILESLKPARAALAAVACVLALGACAREIGKPIDVDAVDRLRPGHSTYEDAIKQFGKATRIKEKKVRVAVPVTGTTEA